jgi:UDP-glucose 4-epimerase
MSVFEGKTLLITGGTGSFGNAVLNRFLRTDIGEIRIFSRDEKKQDDMRHDFQTRMPEVAGKIKFYIGDVRNKSTLKYAMKGVDYVFHAAALKQVPSCEFFPMEAVKTNVIGTDNTLDVAIDAGVECVICLSTDKAAYPINAMGITKAIEEKIAVAKSRNSGKTKICCTRYGNVMCSRGSVIPLWIDQIRKGNPITITEPSMTRFIMSLEEAVDLVLFAFKNGENGDILVQKAPACTIQTQAEAVCELFKHQFKLADHADRADGADRADYADRADHADGADRGEPEIKVIGIRHGEKMYETLLTKEEAAKAIDMGDFYRVPADNRDLNYDKYFVDGDTKRATIEEFNSDNTRRLNLEETKAKIASLEYIQNELNGIPNIV